jgi:hypothetical protein
MAVNGLASAGHGGGGGGLTCPRHGTLDRGLWPVGRENRTAIPARRLRARMIQYRVGMALVSVSCEG